MYVALHRNACRALRRSVFRIRIHRVLFTMFQYFTRVCRVLGRCHFNAASLNNIQGATQVYFQDTQGSFQNVSVSFQNMWGSSTLLFRGRMSLKYIGLYIFLFQGI